jgi:hypothetical protein
MSKLPTDASASPSRIDGKTTPTGPERSPVGRVLRALGAEHSRTEELIGDLVEEFAGRAARDGAFAARWWYVSEAVRSLPYLFWSTLRCGCAHERARLAASVATSSIVLSLALTTFLLSRNGPPARLVPGEKNYTGQIVVSTARPMQLPVRVLDASGHSLPATAVRYAWESGSTMPVSPDGVVQCTDRRDAMVRASLGSLVTRFRLSCQPVQAIDMKTWYNFVVGDAPQAMRVSGIGFDGEPVSRLSANITIENPKIATLDENRLRPLAVGRTFITVSVGDRMARGAITVFEPVASFEALRDDQHYVIASVPLAPGKEVRWSLPVGYFVLVNQVNYKGDAPTMSIEGPVTCMPALGPGVYRTSCLSRAVGATVSLANPASSEAPIVGELALERLDRP